MKIIGRTLILGLTALFGIGTVGMSVSCGRDDRYNIAMFAYKYDDSYISTVRTALVSKFRAHSAEIAYTAYNGENSQQTQSTQIDTAIIKGADLLLINAVDFQASGKALARKAKERDLPVIFFNREVSDESVNLSEKFCFVGTDPAAPGYILGQMIAELLSTDESFRKYDLNGDGKIQYAMFRAEVGNAEADGRTKYSVSEANRILSENADLTVADKSGNILQRVGEDQMANWDSATANSMMSALFKVENNCPNIELVICNNDDMALGVVSALKAKGYNETGSKNDTSKAYIPVYGVDALATALDAMRNGSMEATVRQDGEAMAEAIEEIALNIKAGKDFLDGTEYRFDEGVRKLRIPYTPVTHA